ncbi:MAG: TadE/TadG family type IV pilus assembly protein [Pseudomonadota bacterium]
MTTARIHSRLGLTCRAYAKNPAGAAAAEFALVLTLLIVPLMNVFDIGVYVYQRMQLDNAAQVAVQTAWAQCAPAGDVPATVNNNCAGLAAAMTTALRSTPLGSGVTITSTTESYCCPGAGTITCQGPVATTTPVNCSSGQAPGDYIFIATRYAYSPVYPSLSVASLLTTPITRTAWMRLS